MPLFIASVAMPVSRYSMGLDIHTYIHAYIQTYIHTTITTYKHTSIHTFTEVPSVASSQCASSADSGALPTPGASPAASDLPVISDSVLAVESSQDAADEGALL